MFLGIDIGTSGVKAVITASDGQVVAQCAAALSVSRPHPLWSEQAPDDWVDATHRAVLGLDAGLRREVAGIGLAGQMHGATLLGDDDRPLRPAILWNDGRSHAQCATLEANEPRSRAITGNIAMPGFTAPKLQWVREHEPEIFAATRTVLLPKDYVRLALTGDKASDLSDAAGTLWVDVAERTWSDAMLAATGLTRDHMPSLHEGPDVTGTLRADVAAQWGMEPVPVVAGAGDNAAGALGVGVTGEGQGMPPPITASSSICVPASRSAAMPSAWAKATPSSTAAARRAVVVSLPSPRNAARTCGSLCGVRSPER